MDDMDDVKKILGAYASGAAGTATAIVSTVVVGLSAPVSLAIGAVVALGGLIASFSVD